jgi:hypothetical protein
MWRRDMSPAMTKTQSDEAVGFTPRERDYIRRELDMFFSTYPRVADGFQLKTWRGGPLAGQAKLSPIAKGLVDRGLMRLDTSERLPRLFFTEPTSVLRPTAIGGNGPASACFRRAGGTDQCRTL